MAVALPLPPPLALVPPPARRIGGRPPLAIPNRPIACDEGHRGAIRIHGNPDWGSRPWSCPQTWCHSAEAVNGNGHRVILASLD